jgi:glycosyltransferase involved in cell wall biosynthesis
MSTISVALCTFNGSRYLHDQLVSIASQTRQPDELIICDDCSTDSTVLVARDFSEKVSFHVEVIVNDHTLGPTKNFEKAIGLCSGKLISLSDQDDIWHPEKLRISEEIIRTRSDISAIFSNAEIVDQFVKPMGYDMWQKAAFTLAEQKRVINGNAVSVLLKHYIVTGATLLFRSDYRSSILPIPELWFHDAWIALVLAIVSNISLIPIPLIKYRQHSANYLGGVRKNIIKQIAESVHVNRSDYYKSEIARYTILNRHIEHLSIPVISSKAQVMISEKIRHLAVRNNMPVNRLSRVPYVVRELTRLGYARFARNWGSVAMDLLLR